MEKICHHYYKNNCQLPASLGSRDDFLQILHWTLQAGGFFPPAQPLIKLVPTCQVEGKGDEAMVFAEDPQGLLPLHQGEEIICHRLAIEEIVHTQQEVPGEGGNLVSMSPKTLLR